MSYKLLKTVDTCGHFDSVSSSVSCKGRGTLQRNTGKTLGKEGGGDRFRQ